MSTSHKPAVRHAHAEPAPSHGRKSLKKSERRTFLLPFVVCTFLALPSLLVMVYSRQTPSYEFLMISGVYILAMTFLWFLVPIAAVCALLYLWRGESRAAKSGVAILAFVSVVSFIYIIWPH